MRLLSLQLSPSLKNAGRKSNDGPSSSHPRQQQKLWLSGHQQGLHFHPCPTSWGIFRRFLARSIALSLWKPSNQEVLLHQSILHHLLEYHTLGKDTLSLSLSPATPGHP